MFFLPQYVKCLCTVIYQKLSSQNSIALTVVEKIEGKKLKNPVSDKHISNNLNATKKTNITNTQVSSNAFNWIEHFQIRPVHHEPYENMTKSLQRNQVDVRKFALQRNTRCLHQTKVPQFLKPHQNPLQDLVHHPRPLQEWGRFSRV